MADPNSRIDSGENYIIFGKATGWSNIDLNNLSFSDGIKIQGAASGDQSGFPVSGAGDANNDGYGDIIISAYTADSLGRNETGESYVIFGKNTNWQNIDLNNLTIADGIKIQGAAAFDNSGISVSGAGDVNDDGIDDIIIGAFKADPFGRTQAGESYIIFGKTSWIPTTNPTTNPTVPTTSPSSSLCLNLHSLDMGSVGDLDRINEEIEIHITSTIQEKECGLYFFDLNKGIESQNLDISIPCVKNNFVKVRFYERDICNDDSVLLSIQCSVAESLVLKEVIITPDGIATSNSQCVSVSHQITQCVSASGGIIVAEVGSETCYGYTWGADECGETSITETDSQYHLQFTITSNCVFDSGNTTACILGESYTPGSLCKNYQNDAPTTQTPADGGIMGEIFPFGTMLVLATTMASLT